MKRRVIFGSIWIVAVLLNVYNGVHAQPAASGTITVNPPTPTGNVVAVAGSVTCTLTPNAVPPASFVNLSCSAGTTSVVSAPISPPVGSLSGFTLGVNNAGDAVTIQITQANGTSPLAWSIGANGTAKTGTF